MKPFVLCFIVFDINSVQTDVLLELLVNWSDCIFEMLGFWACKHATVNMSSVVEVNSAFHPSEASKSSTSLSGWG